MLLCRFIKRILIIFISYLKLVNFQGSVISKINATDQDRTNPREISYSIINGNEDGYFLLDKRGHLRVANDIDYDSSGFRAKFKLTVQATEICKNEFCSDKQSSQTKVVITVEDINDEHGEFDSDTYSVSVPESTPVGSIIYSNISIVGQF